MKSNKDSKINVLSANEPKLLELVMRIRREVFIDEQGVPEEIEVDEYEEQSHHFLATVDGAPAGAGRMRTKKSYAKFERIATLQEFRGAGVGRAIMEFMQSFAREKYPQYLPAMHAQRDAIGFYLKLGWVEVGEVFYEADIPHRVLILPPQEKTQIKQLLLWNDPEVRPDIKDYLKLKS